LIGIEVSLGRALLQSEHAALLGLLSASLDFGMQAWLQCLHALCHTLPIRHWRRRGVLLGWLTSGKHCQHRGYQGEPSEHGNLTKGERPSEDKEHAGGRPATACDRVL
jgi:hypothetical protein